MERLQEPGMHRDGHHHSVLHYSNAQAVKRNG